MYLISGADEQKGANTECSALAFALDRTYKELQARALQMPDNFSITYDNTGREGKNQTAANFLMWLQATKKLRSCQDGQGVVGHTHNSLDQRFSVLATILRRSPLLETPQDFVHRIKTHLEPCRGRTLLVQEFDGAWNWKEFFECLELDFSAIAASPTNPDVCHSKRFVARRDLPRMMLPGWEIKVPSCMAHLTPDPADVVMCAKQFWSDHVLSQPPMLVLPISHLQKLHGAGPTIIAERIASF